MKKWQVELYCFEVELCEEDHTWVDIRKLNLPRDLIAKLGDVGIIEIRSERIRSDQINRIFKALRLKRTLGVSLAATAVIMELLDRMEEMHQELEEMHRELERLKREGR